MENPIFENVEIILENINEGLYITLETKFRSSMSIIKDFKIFTPPKKEGGPHFKNFEIQFENFTEGRYLNL